MTDYKQTFAKNLSSLLGNTSANSFAKAVGIPQATISRYLLCQREITVANLCKIADYFDVSTDFLLGRKEY